MSLFPFLRGLGGRSNPSALEVALADATAGWVASVALDVTPADAARIARVRDTVLLDHRRSLALASAAGAPARSGLADRLGLAFAPVLARRAGALALGLSLLTVGAVSAAAGSAPGGPLYETRLAIETLTLPPADTAEGVEARLDQLDERAEEAKTAASKSDGSAVSAALRAYRASLAALFPADRPGGGRGASAGSPGDVAAVVHSVLGVRGVDDSKVRARLQHASEVLLSIPGADASAGSAAAVTLQLVRHLHAVIAAGLTRGDDEWQAPGAAVSKENPGKGKGNGKAKGLEKQKQNKPTTRPTDKGKPIVPQSRQTSPPGSSKE